MFSPVIWTDPSSTACEAGTLAEINARLINPTVMARKELRDRLGQLCQLRGEFRDLR